MREYEDFSFLAIVVAAASYHFDMNHTEESYYINVTYLSHVVRWPDGHKWPNVAKMWPSGHQTICNAYGQVGYP